MVMGSASFSFGLPHKTPRTECARRVLKAMADGVSVSTEEAIQLRNWANNSHDAMGSIEEIARNILKEERNMHARAAEQK
jgi:hypothetical protein